MSLPVRIALVVVGLAAATYGTASLTGGWLGTPPWWERGAPMESVEWLRAYDPNYPGLNGFHTFMGDSDPTPNPRWVAAAFESQHHVESTPYREWISGGVVAAGLALAAFGALPRRRRPTAMT